MTDKWNAEQIADQSGKVVIVTGASSGLGYETAYVLAGKGATVILAVRNQTKGQRALAAIKASYPKAQVSVLVIDLGDLASITAFVNQFKARHQSLALLINNAGIMIPPLQLTKDGFESQFGTNHLGHFALTGRLLDRLMTTPNSRVVTVSSLAAHQATINFANLAGTQGYQARAFYGQSKLANLLFAKELNNKLRAKKSQTLSLTCHPGFAQSNLFSRGVQKKANFLLRFLQNSFSQSTEMGALTILYAATEPSLVGGEYIGPDGPKKRQGYPKADLIIDQLYDYEVASKLWSLSERLTGVTYPL